MIRPTPRILTAAIVATFLLNTSLSGAEPAKSTPLELTLRKQTETSPESGRFHRRDQPDIWDPSQTALIVCDVWDLHHCLRAVHRVEEMGPRLNKVVQEARRRGVTIIHAPSDCMEAYASHPARKRAIAVPVAAELPAEIDQWCSRIPAEEAAVYPIDQSDGGEDDDPVEHAQWREKLVSLGRNPGTPWKKQSDLIEIDSDHDFVSDNGSEIWSILQARGIENVILTGVHTNMCVLGRPFGLRQMVRNGKNVVLMRDMTDTMYNPARWPFVSHFTGTDRIIDHIERYVCPTITSDQFVEGKPFRFQNDKRPHLVVVMAEAEYSTNKTLPEFVQNYLGKDFRVSLVFANDNDRNDIPGIQVVSQADVLLVSIRRRTLPKNQLDVVREYVASGRPVVGIRTASHAFHLLNKPAPDGLDAWPEWDAQVLGGNYHNHHPNTIRSTVRLNPEKLKHPILSGIEDKPFIQSGSLYKTSPLAEATTLLMPATIEGEPTEPAAWTYQRTDGGKSFYTSLGHPGDFEQPAFVQLLRNAIYWASGLRPPEAFELAGTADEYRKHWKSMAVPSDWGQGTDGVLAGYEGPAWYRCSVRIPAEAAGHGAQLVLGLQPGSYEIWINSQLHSRTQVAVQPEGVSLVSVGVDNASQLFAPGEVNLLAVRVVDRGGIAKWADGPTPRIEYADGGRWISLAGTWQVRLGSDETWGTLPLPAKFAVATDSLFEASDAAKAGR